jgi:ABC-type ATPase involved in cell division
MRQVQLLFYQHTAKDIVNSLRRRVITLEDGRIIRDEENGVFSL